MPQTIWACITCTDPPVLTKHRALIDRDGEHFVCMGCKAHLSQCGHEVDSEGRSKSRTRTRPERESVVESLPSGVSFVGPDVELERDDGVSHHTHALTLADPLIDPCAGPEAVLEGFPEAVPSRP